MLGSMCLGWDRAGRHESFKAKSCVLQWSRICQVSTLLQIHAFGLWDHPDSSQTPLGQTALLDTC